MEIKKVKLNHIPAVTEEKDKDGLFQPTHDDIYTFEVTTEAGDTLYVPNDPNNSQYQQLAAWYDEEENKPFDFEFER